jgi:carboxyl-terminal processing protease
MRATLFIIFFIYCQASAIIPDSTNSLINTELEKFKTLLEYSYVYHKDSIDLDSNAEEAFKAYLQSLDSKSNYFPAEQYKSLKEANTGIKKSVGIMQIVFSDSSYVFRVEKGSSADSNGIKPGWRILSINDSSVIGKEEVAITEILSDTAVKSFNIRLLDMSGNIQNKILHSSPHINSSIDVSFMLNDTVGYIKSLKFTKDAGEEFEKAISAFPNGLKGLVIDLRDNPGGVLDAVGNVISLFIEKGKQVIKTKAKNPEFDYNVKSKTDGKFIGLPLVVLVNGESASAAELFAGAVQDYDLGIVMGQRTYGKGTLQKNWEFKDGSAFRITVGEYVTPLGRKVQKDAQKAFTSDIITLDSSLDKQLKNIEIPSNVTITKSSKGRSLLSIGGILPDSLLPEQAEPTRLTKVAQQKRVIIRTAFEVFLAEWKNLIGGYSDFNMFCRQFRFNNLIYDKIENNLRLASLKNDAMYEKDKSRMAELVKERLAQLLYGDVGYYCSNAYYDTDVAKAIKTVRVAQQLVKSN